MPKEVVQISWLHGQPPPHTWPLDSLLIISVHLPQYHNPENRQAGDGSENQKKNLIETDSSNTW